MSMRIAIDVREACATIRTGKGQWVYGFVSELLQRNHSLVLLTNTEVPEEWKKQSTCITFPPGILWHLRAAKYLRRNTPDFFLGTTSFIVPLLLRGRVPTVCVIHDLIAFQNEPHQRKAIWIEKIILPRILRFVRRFFMISESTKKDFLLRFPFVPSEKVSVIYAGPFNSNPSPNVSDAKTILCIGTLCPRKNQLRLIQAYSQLPITVSSHYQLILVGARGWQDDEIIRAANQTPGVSWLQYVPDEVYESLLTSCAIFALPSLYEGFGIPVLDALQRGVPVLTSKRGSLSEVAGNAAILVDPEDVSSIRDGLLALVCNPDVQAELRKKGLIQAQKFSWKRTVDLFLSRLSD